MNKEKASDELIIANREIAFQNNEKENCASELIIVKHEKEAIVDELRKSESRLKQTQTIAHIGSWELDYATGIAIWSDEQLKIYGLSPEDSKQSFATWTSYIHAEDLDDVLQKTNKTKTTLNNSDLFHRIIRKDGTVRHLYSQTRVQFNKEGIPIGLYGVTQDVTERKEAEESLKKSEANLRAIFENASEGFILTDTNGIIKSFNNNAKETIRLNTKQEVKVNDSIFDFIHPSRKANYKNAIAQVLNGETLRYDFPYSRKNGEIKWFDFTVNPVYKAGSITGLSITSADITERKKTEEALQQSESNLKAVIENTDATIFSLNTDLQYITFNQRYQITLKEIFNVDVKVGDHVFDTLIMDTMEASSWQEIYSSALKGETVKFEKEFYFNNIYSCISFSIHPIWEDQRVIGLSCFTLDITKNKIDENKLIATSIELQKALTDLNKILDSSIDVICTMNGNGEFVKVSTASQQVWGYTPEELIGTKFMDIVYPEDVDITAKAAEKIASNIQVPIFENRYVHKSGRVVPILWSVNWDEKLQLMFCVGKDVTEKKLLEKAVENERDQFFNMFLKAPSAIGMLKGADHVFEMVNQPYLQLIGKKDIIGKPLAEVLPEIGEQGFIDILDSVFTTGKSYTGTEILVKIDKEGNGDLTDAYLNFIYQAYRNNYGKIEGIFFFANDITEQILSRKEIEKSEKFFKGVIENSADMITLLDATGKRIYASPAVAKIFGYTFEEFLSLNITERVHPDDLVIKQESLGKVMAHPGVPIEVPLIRERKKDGTYMWVEAIITNFLETEGINAIVANFRDVTESKKAKEKLIESEKHSRDLFEKSVIGLALARMDGTLADVNEAYAKIIGRTIEETLKLTYWEITPEKYHEQEDKVLKELMDTGKFINYEKEYIHKNGQLVPVRLSGNIIERDGEKYIWSSVEDITESKKAEAEDRFKANLLNTIGQAAVATDLSGVINYWNKAAEHIYGWTKEEAIGKNVMDLVPSEATIEQATQIMEELQKGHTWSGEFISQRKDGTSFTAFVTDSPIYDENNILSGIIGISSDITEKKKLEELLEKTNRLAAVGSWEIDVVKGTVYWSDITKEIREVGKDFVPQLDIGISYFKEGTHKETISQKVKECIENGTPWDEELEIITFKGNPKWVRTIGEGEFLNGKCIRVHGSFQDIDKRKKIEEAIRQSNERYHLIAKASNDSIWDWDLLSNEVVRPDKKIEHLLGYENVAPSDVDDFWQTHVHPEDWKRVTENRAILFADVHKDYWQDEYRFLKPDGTYAFVYDRGYIIRDENKRPIRFIGASQDITARKNAEIETLKVYEEKNAILESIGDGFYTLDKNWVITYWNSQAEKMMGKAKNEMLGKIFWEVYPDVIGTPLEVAYLEAVKENTIQNLEMHYEKFKKWYQVSVYPSPNGVSVYFQDITERKLAEEQIKTDKNLLRALIDNLPDTIFYKDKSAKKLISNKFDYYSILGADTEQEVLGKTDLEMSSHANASITYAQDMEILNTGNPLINFEEYFTTADNQPLWLSTSKLPLRNEDNEIIGLLGIGRDITQRKVAEDKLVELNTTLEKNVQQLKISNADLEQFAFVASHDLQEPLRMVTSFLTLLEKKYGNSIDDKGKQYIDFAVDGAKRMRQIILDLLEFSRIGRVEDKTEEVDLNELVEEIIRLHSKQINETKAVLNIAKLPVLNISRTPMRQVFQNLISNGLKYHKDGVVPQISISVNSVGEFWQFAISDNGIGIGKAYLDKIFIIFQRLHNKEKYSGTGIGLAITKKIIESMGGSIRVESEEGKGSTFYFTIPKKN
ncbi:MAG: PAS domain S-box protein [Ginsengibacter sp.]